tara:strand:- start:752 stop:1948 length:1197 start_codon:yes stop_codon:yes gene_type:complete
MKQIILCLIGLILTQQGCALVPTQLHLSKKPKPAGYHNQKELKEHKLAKQQHKTEKTHPSLKERITLVDFKFFDKDKHKNQKHHKKTITTPATGKVSTAFYPFGIDLVDIPGQGTTLMSFLVEHELDSAVATTQAIIREKVKEDADTKAKTVKEDELAAGKTAAEATRAAELARAAKAAQVEDEEKGKINSILDLRPDVIVLQQDSVATVLPRAMLGYPQIANMPVAPDDGISTLDIVKQDLSNENQFLSTRTENDENNNLIPIEFALTGFTKQSGRLLTNEKDKVNKTGEIDSVTKEYSQEFKENAQAVTVIYRNYRGQLFRIIMPNQYYGALSLPKKLDNKEDKAKKEANKNEIEKWIRYYENFRNMAIQKGDVIEFTTLDLLDLTSPVHALPAVR